MNEENERMGDRVVAGRVVHHADRFRAHESINQHDLHGHFHGVVLKNLSDEEIAQLPERERLIYEHHRMHQKHAHHESMHLAMFLILVLVCMLAQVLLLEWKRRKPYYYQLTTLIGLWLVPLIFSAYLGWYRFVFVWVAFSVVSSYIMRLATRRPLATTTPRIVYRFFLSIYQISYAIGVLAYVILFLCLTGLNILLLLSFPTALDAFGILLFYGLYFGVLGRDLAEVCSDTMASQLGYYNKSGLPSRQLESTICAVCGNSLFKEGQANQQVPEMVDLVPADVPDIDDGNDLQLTETVCKLNCGHTFHDFCIRGWCIIGKKETCPYCSERVDLKRLFPSPWNKQHMLYGQLLDWVRYLVAWQPIILIIVQGINKALQLE